MLAYLLNNSGNIVPLKEKFMEDKVSLFWNMKMTRAGNSKKTLSYMNINLHDFNLLGFHSKKPEKYWN
jgi:hypothetical protein